MRGQAQVDEYSVLWQSLVAFVLLYSVRCVDQMELRIRMCAMPSVLGPWCHSMLLVQ